MRGLTGALCALLAAPGMSVAATTFTEILGRPTDHSIAVNARGDAASELYFEYGVKPGVYTSQTKSGSIQANEPIEQVMEGLAGNTRYFYRMRYRNSGSTGEFSAGVEHSFMTQRAPGSSFVFCVQGDSHPERAGNMFSAELYARTMRAVAAEQPDFFLTSGDDFSIDQLQTVTAATVAERYTLQLPYFGLMAHSTPLFLVNGNHEQAARYLLNGTPNSPAVWAQNSRNKYYSQPAPDGFYTGNTEVVPHIGLLRNYFAWEWGDALFVTIDPYWSSPVPVDNVFGVSSQLPGQNGKTTNKWEITHGDAQYEWLKKTLESSRAKWKFVFAHHTLGTGRGGVEIADEFEWGGNNANGSFGFPANRPGWALPIHQLFVANKVTVFFQAHDHLFARQELDGVIYQSLPNPADNTYTAFNEDAYKSGDKYPNSGFVKVRVGPDSVKVEYIRQFLTKDEKPPAQVSGMVQFAYSRIAPVVTRVANAASQSPVIAPNTWVEIDGINLAPAGMARTWGASDIVRNQLPKQLDGVSATVNGKPAYVYYASPGQVNILTPPDAMTGMVPVEVTVGGVVSSRFLVQAAAISPSFFVFGGGPHLAATHANGALVGPTGLFPGASTPARPGEMVVFYANGLGETDAPVVPGLSSQTGLLTKWPELRIGGQAATVAFAGLVSPGLYQLNVVVPAGVGPGDVPVEAISGEKSTQSGVVLNVQR